jgi:hypothetical protein
VRLDVAGRVGPVQRDQHRRGLLQAPQILLHRLRRGVAAGFEVAANEFGLAQSTVDRLERARRVFGQHLGEAARGLFGGRNGAVISRVEVRNQHRAAREDDHGGEARQHVVGPAGKKIADRPRQRANPAHAHRPFPREARRVGRKRGRPDAQRARMVSKWCRPDASLVAG